MKAKTVVLLLAALSSSVFSSAVANAPLRMQDTNGLVPDEVKRLDDLIAATQTSLKGQRVIRGQIIEFQKLQAHYLQHPDSKELLLQLVKVAVKLQEAIKAQHLTSAFSTEFINDLSIFAQIGSKKGTPK